MGTVRTRAWLFFTVLCLVVGCSSCWGPAGAGKPEIDPSSLPQQQIVQAASTGNIEWIHQIIASDPRLVNYQEDDRRTPLHFAAAHGQDDAVKYLLENGADPSLADEDGLTPRTTAFQWGHAGTAKVIEECIAGMPKAAPTAR